MYEQALQGYKDALGLKNVENHRSALNTMTNRDHLYVKQEELTKTEEAYSRALLGIQTVLGSSSDEYQSIKAMIKSLGVLSGKTQCIAN